MKTEKFSRLVVMVCLFLPLCVNAQGTLEVSNLGQIPAGSMAVASDSWIGQAFRSGTDYNSYTLDSIQLLMNAPSGNPGVLIVSIYNSVNGMPGTLLGDLSGPAPVTGGVYTYSASGITLAGFSFYYVVLTSTTSAAQGAYDWSSANSAVGNGRWEIIGPSLSSSDGLTWSSNPPQTDVFQLAVNVTPVPEPTALVLIAIGTWLSCLYRSGRS